MSASTDADQLFRPLDQGLCREHVDAVEGLLAQQRALCFDGELGLGSWDRVDRAVRARVDAMKGRRRDEALREARLRLRSPVAGEAETGAFLVAVLDDAWDGRCEPMAGKRRDAAPVYRGLRAAWELRPIGEQVLHVTPKADPAAIALYSLGRDARSKASGDFAGWLLEQEDAFDLPGAEIAIGVFGDVRVASRIKLRGHAGIRALGWLGVPSALRPLVPLLDEGAPPGLVRSVATALFAASGRWFVQGGLPALRRPGPARGDPDAARTWLRASSASDGDRRHHLGVRVEEPWPHGDEPMSRRWLRAQLGLADAPTSRELPEALLGVSPPPRLGPTNLAFLPPAPWVFPE